MLSKMNYRPISVLPCLSKIFEKLLIDQLRLYFKPLEKYQPPPKKINPNLQEIKHSL